MTHMGQEGKAASNRGHPGRMTPHPERSLRYSPKGGKHTELFRNWNVTTGD